MPSNKWVVHFWHQMASTHTKGPQFVTKAILCYLLVWLKSDDILKICPEMYKPHAQQLC